MDQVIQTFVTQIRELAREEARDMIAQVLGGVSVPTKSNGIRMSDSSGTGRIKRSGEELEKMSQVLVAFVSKHPGLRIEQINKQLQTTTKDLQLPIRKLMAEGVLKTKGVRRATAYYTGSADMRTESNGDGAKAKRKKKAN